MARSKIASEALQELQALEEQLTNAADAYETARARLTLTTQKYSAIRDFATEHFWVSPYSPSLTKTWENYPSKGRWRFIGMKAGEAITEILRESAPLSLNDIALKLKSGGFSYPEGFDTRNVNAALMKTAGVDRVEPEGDGAPTLFTRKADVEVDDLQFE